jgi:hypothetical protein
MSFVSHWIGFEPHDLMNVTLGCSASLMIQLSSAGSRMPLHRAQRKLALHHRLFAISSEAEPEYGRGQGCVSCCSGNHHGNMRLR